MSEKTYSVELTAAELRIVRRALQHFSTGVPARVTMEHALDADQLVNRLSDVEAWSTGPLARV